MRFGKREIFATRKGVEIPVFQIESAEFRGQIADLTLRFSDSVRIMAFARSERQRKKAEETTLVVSLRADGKKIELYDARMREESKGVRMPSQGEMRTFRKMFTLARCGP
ncbi:MAG: hypothetical protein AB7F96_21460 [Beijerinckiaceae bacterium]